MAEEKIIKRSEQGYGENYQQSDSDNPAREIPTPKISLIIGGGLMFVFVVLDVVDIIVKLVGADDFFVLDLISYIFMVPYIIYYKYFKKADFSGHLLIMSLLELIPYLGTLPLRSIGHGITMWIDRHPEGRLAKATHLALKVIPARKGVANAKVPARGNTNRYARVMKRSDEKIEKGINEARQKIDGVKGRIGIKKPKEVEKMEDLGTDQSMKVAA